MKKRDLGRLNKKYLKQFRTQEENILDINEIYFLYYKKVFLDDKCQEELSEIDKCFIYVTKDFVRLGIWEEIQKELFKKITSPKEKISHEYILRDKLSQISKNKRLCILRSNRRM